MNDDLISRKALLRIYKNWLPQLTKPEDAGDRNGVETCIAVLEDAPAVDAEPVKYGKWRKTRSPKGKIDLWPPTYECTECNSILFGSPRTNYCSNCGAKMDKEEKT